MTFLKSLIYPKENNILYASLIQVILRLKIKLEVSGNALSLFLLLWRLIFSPVSLFFSLFVSQENLLRLVNIEYSVRGQRDLLQPGRVGL